MDDAITKHHGFVFVSESNVSSASSPRLPISDAYFDAPFPQKPKAFPPSHSKMFEFSYEKAPTKSIKIKSPASPAITPLQRHEVVGKEASDLIEKLASNSGPSKPVITNLAEISGAEDMSQTVEKLNVRPVITNHIKVQTQPLNSTTLMPNMSDAFGSGTGFVAIFLGLGFMAILVLFVAIRKQRSKSETMNRKKEAEPFLPRSARHARSYSDAGLFPMAMSNYPSEQSAGTDFNLTSVPTNFRRRTSLSFNGPLVSGDMNAPSDYGSEAPVPTDNFRRRTSLVFAGLPAHSHGSSLQKVDESIV